MRDFFLYLGAMAGLYVSFGAVLSLSFAYINYLFPDIVGQGYAYERGFYTSSVQWQMALIVVFFPVFLFLTSYLRKEISRQPGRLNLWIRRFLVFLTIFITAVVVLGDLVAILRSFLGGELSSRFLLKAGALLIISSLVLVYYILDIRGTYIKRPIISKIFGVVSVVLVLGLLTAVFSVTGSPAHQRLLKIDARKVYDLQDIQWHIQSYWQKKDRLPEVLSELNDDFSGYRVPTDPESDLAYEYQKKDKLSFELCATFNTKTSDERNGGGGYLTKPVALGLENSSNWQHEAGRQCFVRKIDPELSRKELPAYPPVF